MFMRRPCNPASPHQDSLAASPGLQPPPLAPSAARRRVTFAEEPQVFLIPALRQLWLVARKCDLWHGHAEEEERG